MAPLLGLQVGRSCLHLFQVLLQLGRDGLEMPGRGRDELFEGRNVSGKRREQNSISISLSLSFFLFGYNSTIPWRFARSASKLLTTTTPRTCKGSNAATGSTRRASPVGREAPTKTNPNHHAVLVVARGRRLLQQCSSDDDDAWASWENRSTADVNLHVKFLVSEAKKRRRRESGSAA